MTLEYNTFIQAEGGTFVAYLAGAIHGRDIAKMSDKTANQFEVQNANFGGLGKLMIG